MDKQQAQTTIRDVLQKPFDREKYINFISNLLNHIERRDVHYSGSLVPEAYRGHINQYWRVGKYVSPDDEQMDVLVVEVKSLSKLDRARTTLRNFAINRLKQFEKDYSLIAFYSKEDQGADWRFSFVKIEHEAYQDDKGKVKTRTDFTPARRYSFLVGEHETSYTAQKQLLPLLQADIADPTIKSIEDAFSIEKVTDEFFQQYSELYLKLSAHISKEPALQCKSKEETRQNVSRFAKKLLGQIVFLYFLQKKGWLGVPKDQNWGTGSRRFMRERFEQNHQANQNYYGDFLQYLFYEALANDRKGTEDPAWYARFDCKIPFLNGGLFEADYDWQANAIKISNDLFHNGEKNKAGDIGTGILDVFDRYNFTIKEDEPLEKEVAVDPEMLGKVFENMLDVSERKSKGAFYTPREIVHYMCQESLIHYLADSVKHIPKVDLEAFIRKGHLFLENDMAAMQADRKIASGEQLTTKHSSGFPASIREYADLLDEKLANIKICDPAIGSGAFPVGLLHEIVNARLILQTLTGKNVNAYELKRHCIQQSIYGVDIDASAIDIARLRLWLSLIVDESDYATIAALPNLDYKIMQGNSLVEDFEGIQLFNDDFINQQDDTDAKIEALKKERKQLETEFRTLLETKKLTVELKKQLDKKSATIEKKIAHLQSAHIKQGGVFDLINEAKLKAEKLEELHKNFFSACTPTKKAEIRDQISILEWELIEATLKERNQTNALQKIQTLKQSNEKPFFLWKLNFPEVFKQHGGFDVVIANPPYIDSEMMVHQGLEKLRAHLSEKMKFTRGNWDIYVAFFEVGLGLLNSTSSLIFITPDKWLSKPFGEELRKGILDNVYSITETGRKVFKTAKVDSIITIITSRKNSLLESLTFIDGKAIQISLIEKSILETPFSFDWLFSSHINLLLRLEKLPYKFIEFALCENACATSDAYKLKEYINNIDPNEFDASKYLKVINTGTIGKYTSKWGDKPMTYLKEKYAYPVVKRDRFLQDFKNSYGKISIKSKIIIKGLTLLDGCLDKEGTTVPGKTTLVVTSDYLYLALAIINSEIAIFYIKQKYQGSSYNQGITFTKTMINNLPSPDIRAINTQSIETLIEYFLVPSYGKELLLETFYNQLINGLVYELYFPKEIKAANKEILKHLEDIKPITNDMSEEVKLAIIQSEFDRLYDPGHPVRNNLETLDSVEPVRIIKEALR
jgi:hypothetical protein